jgi:hypothetical protein
MKRLLFVSLLLGVWSAAFADQPHSEPLVASLAEEEEVFVDQVVAWNDSTGEERTMKIYRQKTYDGEIIYIAHKVYEWGESGVFGVVLPEDPEEANGYRHSAKVGLIGRYYFTSYKIPYDYQPSERYY